MTVVTRPALARPEWFDKALANATGCGIGVAVIDSGWDRSIDDQRIRQGMSFVDPESPLSQRVGDDDHDRIGHGTACASLLLSVAPDAHVVPLRVFGDQLEWPVRSTGLPRPVAALPRSVSAQ